MVSRVRWRCARIGYFDDFVQFFECVVQFEFIVERINGLEWLWRWRRIRWRRGGCVVRDGRFWNGCIGAIAKLEFVEWR
jgi:hypothetical protein